MATTEEKTATIPQFECTVNFNKTVGANVDGMDLTMMPNRDVQSANGKDFSEPDLTLHTTDDEKAISQILDNENKDEAIEEEMHDTNPQEHKQSEEVPLVTVSMTDNVATEEETIEPDSMEDAPAVQSPQPESQQREVSAMAMALKSRMDAAITKLNEESMKSEGSSIPAKPVSVFRMLEQKHDERSLL